MMALALSDEPCPPSAARTHGGRHREEPRAEEAADLRCRTEDDGSWPGGSRQRHQEKRSVLLSETWPLKKKIV